MFPNPVKKGETVYFSNTPFETGISIMNYSGKIIYRDLIKVNTYKMETVNLTTGMYFIKMTHKKETTILKMIIN